jgi:hypothetical protein
MESRVNLTIDATMANLLCREDVAQAWIGLERRVGCLGPEQESLIYIIENSWAIINTCSKYRIRIICRQLSHVRYRGEYHGRKHRVQTQPAKRSWLLRVGF